MVDPEHINQIHVRVTKSTLQCTHTDQTMKPLYTMLLVFYELFLLQRDFEQHVLFTYIMTMTVQFRSVLLKLERVLYTASLL